jgi:hypothetical protein
MLMSCLRSQGHLVDNHIGACEYTSTGAAAVATVKTAVCDIQNQVCVILSRSFCPHFTKHYYRYTDN